MIPNGFVTFNWMIRHFGENINAKKHSMRGGYKKRGKK